MSQLTEISNCGGCRGCKNPPQEEHSCPYQADVNNDEEYQCTCCEDCTHECAMEI